ncbi:hypothetical protein HPB48_015408 [Haemaphysalis longicornis]|uniref:Uncharacterized protein n=1 Tax=Haemaphysalis longicornis TaxID=44386 RepID=A0A9J6FQ59_HAELO|nr:hypothetical protein HPB48_015408 [Haemaphysalis longicornis]
MTATQSAFSAAAPTPQRLRRAHSGSCPGESGGSKWGLTSPPVRATPGPRLHDRGETRTAPVPDPKPGEAAPEDPTGVRVAAGCARSPSRGPPPEAVPQAPREETEKAPKTPRHRCIG